MVYREYKLTTYADYENSDDDTIYEYNYFFCIEGIIIEKKEGFYVWERGEGNTYTNALNNAYDKIFKTLSIRYHLCPSPMRVDSVRKILSNNKEHGSRFMFFDVDDSHILKYNEENECYMMTLEDKQNIVNAKQFEFIKVIYL
jgi:hypothetical protein